MAEWLFGAATAGGPAHPILAALLDASLKGALLVLCAGACAQVLRRASAATRHLLWALVVAGLLALPVLSLALPAWELALVPGAVPAAVVGQSSREAELVRLPAAARTAPESVWGGAASGAPPAGGEFHWPRFLLLVWAAGAAFVLGRLLLGTVRVWCHARRARPLAGGVWARSVGRLCSRLGVRRPPRLLESGARAMPMTFGLLRPVVLLPAGAEAWPAARRESVLLHELAHLRRRDYAVQLACELACALYWFHPLVWWATGRLESERERACDDAVLRAGPKPSAYARHLLETARTVRAPRRTTSAAAAMARRSQLEGRILAVLEEGRRRGGVPRRLVVPAALAAAVLVIPLAAMHPVPAAVVEPIRTARVLAPPPNRSSAPVPDSGRVEPITMDVEPTDLWERASAPPASLGVITCTDETAPRVDGIYICALALNGPLARAGVDAGDVLLSVAGERVPTREALERLLAGREIGERVHVAFRNFHGDGRIEGARVRLAPRFGGGSFTMRFSPRLAEETRTVDPNEMEIREVFVPLPDSLEERAGISAGLLVTRVPPREEYNNTIFAALPYLFGASGLRPDDIITAVGEQPITDIESFFLALEEVQNHPFAVKVARGGGTVWLRYEPESDGT